MNGLLPTPTPSAAERVLRRVFGKFRGSVAFRLWDGREVQIGPREPACTAVIRSPDTFVRLIRRPTPYAFAEAFIEGAIDLEGDLFAVMEVANEVEDLRLTARDRLDVLLALWKG